MLEEFRRRKNMMSFEEKKLNTLSKEDHERN